MITTLVWGRAVKLLQKRRRERKEAQCDTQTESRKVEVKSLVETLLDKPGKK